MARIGEPMAAGSLDTFRIVKRLREAGLDERQAETITDVLRETRELDLGQLATKADVEKLGLELRSEISELRSELKGDIAGLRTELKGEIAGLRTEIASGRAELLKWLVPLLLGQAGLVAALVRLL